ncbi:MAG TPA: tetratricopeptide repeat protein [Gemmatimonadaceae bacterium]|nr:tetratricopeptide repeat protein [Gemmatimonadaceae bacterium]
MTTRLDPDRWRRIGEVLDAALSREPKHWPAVLDAACAGAPDLRREVEELLARVDRARAFLESPPTAAAAAVVAETKHAQPSESGRRIGAYQIAHEIGRGGMSRVFLAHRADGQFEQRVALKLLRPGLDTEIDQARFRAERQILASLNHPNIARLLDGGLTDSGQPYLVLEYVDGHPIDAYCDANALSIRERLRLFLMVAEATQYAHRNLIVHRDIKSSNIFVSVDGAVKLLDFGLAKLLEPDAYGRESSRMQTVAHWMTPEYAAPEQIRREAVTTLTDVYQLGAVLYRLLTGRLPFTTANGDLHELQAAVLRGDPMPPSAAIAGADAARGRLLRGDLDAITLKALRKEPVERYASVDALGDDVRRYLSGHPVLARRITPLYRMRRFVRRHRIETVAATGISLSVLVGAGVAMWQARRAARERDLAAAASRESQAVTSFVMGLFNASDPTVARGDPLSAVELVRRAVARADLLDAEPLAHARMLEVTARLYQSLGRYTEAFAILQRAIAIRRALRPGNPAELAAALGQMSELLLRLGRYAAADSVARQALELQQRTLGRENPAVAGTLHQIASIAIYLGRLQVAERSQREALAVSQQAFGENDSLTAERQLQLGAIFRREGRMADAEREFRGGLASLSRALGPDNPQVADAMMALAYLLDEVRGRYAEADTLYRRAIQIRRRAFGETHPLFAASLLDYAELMSRRGDRAAAVLPARQAVDIVIREYGVENSVVAVQSSRLAAILYRAGNVDEAARLYRRSIATTRRLRGPDHENLTGLKLGLAQIMIDHRDYVGADSLIRDAIRIRELAGGPDNPGTAPAEGLLGMLMTREGKYAAADSVLRHSLAVLERQVGRDYPDVRQLYGYLADLEDARGRRAEASRYRAIAIAR